MGQYIYLLTSLYDLTLDSGKMPISVNDYFEFCETQLNSKDFENFKKLYFFNDLKNVLNYKKQGDVFLQPSFYTFEKFNELINDTDFFIPFLAEYYYNKKISYDKLYPEMTEIDELIYLFYQNLNNFVPDGFVKEYFLFELELKNISTAFSLRKNHLTFNNKIIPYGIAYERLLEKNSKDFDLLEDFPYVEKMIEIFDDKDVYRLDQEKRDNQGKKMIDLLQLEKKIEDIRWNWLSDNWEGGFFSTEMVYSYAIKLQSVERWFGLSKEKGQELLDKLLNNIKGSIKFDDTIGGN